jgi:hypothetical protein
MKRTVILLGLSLLLAVTAAAENLTARGTFDVSVTRQKDEGEPFGRYAFDKQFSGDLVATSKGRMLSAETPVQGSAGYVAFESVTGVLNGKSGSFILQHKGTMKNGQYNMQVTVLPDSGTEELIGLGGAMTIRIENGKHYYEFEYTLNQQ